MVGKRRLGEREKKYRNKCGRKRAREVWTGDVIWLTRRERERVFRNILLFCFWIERGCGVVSRVCLRFMFRNSEIQSRFIKNKVHRINKLLFSLFFFL